MSKNIILIGFSGTGKSSSGQAVADILGWDFLDIDAEVSVRAGKPISDIFTQEGEGRFRDWERQVLHEACSGHSKVIATGGGAIVDPVNRELIFSSGTVVCLEARPEIIFARLAGYLSGTSDWETRPLLDARHPLDHIRLLKETRQVFYAMAHWTVHTDNFSIQAVAREVVRSSHMVNANPRSNWHNVPGVAAVVSLSSGSYPVMVGWELTDGIGELLKSLEVAKVAYLISDSRVPTIHIRRVQRSLERASIQAHLFRFPSGESNKTLDTAAAIYRWMAQIRAERGHLVVAVGGGVVGDLAGFVAATFTRGMAFVQLPTTLAAMVDASIGGKVAVDLPVGKNLVGAFHQPRMVVADLATLTTLPKRELLSGWAEAVKHGLILDQQLFRQFEDNTDSILNLDRETTLNMIRRSAALKAGVVTEDERETLGRRTLLNYGHTIGHALEVATGYESLLHGEAVAIGMMGAAIMSNRMGLLSDDDVSRQETVLKRLSLPTTCAVADASMVVKAIEMDKKTSGREVKWVLLDGIGNAVVRGGIPQSLVSEVVNMLCSKEACT